MPRRIRSFVTACRLVRQAVTIWSWINRKFALVAGACSRGISSISQGLAAVWQSIAGAVTPAPGKSVPKKPRPNVAKRFPRWRRMASISGFRKSGRAGRISRIRPRSSSASWNTSAGSAASRPSSSSSITIRRQGAAREAGSWKPSVGSSAKTSTRVGRRSLSPCGPRMILNVSCKIVSETP